MFFFNFIIIITISIILNFDLLDLIIKIKKKTFLIMYLISKFVTLLTTSIFFALNNGKLDNITKSTIFLSNRRVGNNNSCLAQFMQPHIW